MREDLRGIIETASVDCGASMASQIGFEPFAEAREYAFEQFVKRQYNDNIVYDSVEFSDAPCAGHSDTRINEILDAIRSLGMEGTYTLHLGEAHYSYFVGEHLERVAKGSHQALLLRNDKEGFQMEFQLLPNGPHRHFDYGHVHVLFFRRDAHRQGSFVQMKRFITGDMKSLMLDTLGYLSLQGHASWSENSEIRNPKPKQEDWRYKQRYIGLNRELQPRYISGIELFYLRMGFVPDVRDYIDGMYRQNIMLLADGFAFRIRDDFGEEAWFELTKLHQENHREWHKIVKEREAQLGQTELARRLKAAEQRIQQESI
tara:strand:+ start:823 stop:1770 length:948 start_codon:yes stop_codon:yes gene_type:complete